MDLIGLLVTVIIAGLIFWVLWYIVRMLPLPEPFRTVAMVVLGLIAVIFLLSLLFGGLSLPKFRLG